MDAAERASAAIERRLMNDINAIYSQSLKSMLADQKSFLQKIADIDAGKIKPPAFYDTQEKILKWRQGFTRELLRKEKVIAGIRARLQEAGAQARPLVQGAMGEVYAANRTYTAGKIASQANITFAQYDKRQIDVLLKDTMSPFSKIAYKGMGANQAIVRKLSREMAQATINGESQRDIVKRIRAVTGQSKYQATRVAQTERTRIQSQARSDTLTEAEALGVKTTKKWSARMVNTRDTHADLDKEPAIPSDKPFSNGLMYPGDPNGPASEVINCHCVLIPGVADKQDSMDNVFAKNTSLNADLTSAGVEDRMNNSEWFKKGSSSVDMGGVDTSTAKSIERRYNDVFARYPALLGKIDSVKATKISGMHYADCARLAGGAVRLNTDYYLNVDALSSRYAKDVAKKFHPAGTDWTGIVTHEIGHAVDGYLTNTGVAGSNTYGYKSAATMIRAKVMKQSGLKLSDVASNLSIYATKSAEEWFAEAFCEGMTSAAPRTVAANLMKELDNLLGGVVK